MPASALFVFTKESVRSLQATGGFSLAVKLKAICGSKDLEVPTLNIRSWLILSGF